jgi:GNAT superfamily N-acetyltransferase
MRTEVSHSSLWLEVDDSPDPEEIARLESLMRAETATASGHADAVDLVVVAREGSELRGGVCGWTWGGCCELDSLWVDPSLRGAGLGSRLLAAAEGVAQQRGCRQVVLFTHGFQASAGFYEHRGYDLVGRVEDYPSGSTALWFRKPLRVDR